LSGNYASDFLANTAVGTALGLETLTGQITSDGISMLTGLGTLDVNSFSIVPPGTGKPSLNASLTTGSFSAAANGRFPLILTIGSEAGQPVPSVTSINPVCYILDANSCLLLGLDSTAPGTGILELQNTGL
jgi:hypothetical protein